jgi:hypothetical protein
MYDFNNTSPVDALQTTAANQPAWSTDASLPTGVRAPLYDGLLSVMNVNDLGIFNNQAAGTLITSVKDLARTTGDTAHIAVFVSRNTTAARAQIVTRNTTDIFSAGGRRLDADTFVQSSVASSDGLNYLVGLFVWGGNTLQLVSNGSAQTVANYSSGAGSTSATDSLAYTLGASSTITNRLNGLVTDHAASRFIATTAQLSALRTLEKAYYPSLP